MSHPQNIVAAAVVTALNAATFSQEFTALRRYGPRFNVEDSTDVEVLVIPRSDSDGDGTVGLDTRKIVIHVGVFKRLANSVDAETAEMDDMTSLCREIYEAFYQKRIGASSEIVNVDVDNDPPYSVEDLVERRVFLSVVELTFLIDVAV